jgi:hypothetical protein
MLSIHDRFLKAKARLDAQERASRFTRANRRDLEWLILGAVCELLKQHHLDHPTFAVEGESPDFETLREDQKTTWAGVEITEALLEGRQRNKEMANEPTPGLIVRVPPPVQEPFKTLREALLKKAAKPYASSCVLLVYFNLSDWNLSYDENAFAPMLQDEAEARPFVGVAAFRRVIVMDASMRQLVELKPINAKTDVSPKA